MSVRDATILVVDDDPGQRQLLDNALARAGFATLLCEDGASGLESASQSNLVLLDVRMPGMSGLEVLARLRVERPELPVILLTAYMDLRDAVSVIKQGAVDYLEKPVDLDELILAVDEALGIERRSASTAPDLELPSGVIAESGAMRSLFAQAQRAAPTDATMLITGESGVGKQVIAEYVQRQSHRASCPLVTVNCGAFPERLIESELFGYVKGAFTGADMTRAGRFESADSGTLFLDEIGELPLDLQPVFLRVLESGVFQRVGESVDRRADVRLIAATNQDLTAAVHEGRFREDLYYRLNVFPLHVPALRERREDILPLAKHWLRVKGKGLSPAAERCLLAYDWPGNVRELRNALDRALILSDSRQILCTDLPPSIQKNDAPTVDSGGVLMGTTMAQIQRQAILDALDKTGGNKTRAAEVLGISRRSLVYKLREYGM